MIYAKPTTSIEAVIDTGETGLVGTIGTVIHDNQATVVDAFDDTGVSEIADGVYAADRTSPSVSGDYTIIWTRGDGGEVLGVETLTVTASGLPDVTVPATLDGSQGLCAAWTDAAQILDCCQLTGTDINETVLDAAAAHASLLLFELSGRRYNGICDATVRPCAELTSCFVPHRTGHHHGCGCRPLSYVRLAGYPVREIVEVTVDGDVVSADEYRLDRKRELVALGDRRWPRCFPAGTLVLTARGLRPIELIRRGERVLTHRNRWRRVLAAKQTGVSETVRVIGRGGALRCTPDHLIWASERRQRYAYGNRVRALGRAGWTAARHMVGSAWATPRTVERLPIPMPLGWSREDLPDNFWWFVGRWVGDGWTDGTNRVSICCGRHEEVALAQALQQTGWEWRASGGQVHAARWRLHSPELRAWLREQFGTSAEDKEIPAWLLGCDEEIREAFVAGYVSADGWTGSYASGRGRPYTSIHTVSRKLALGIRLLVGTLGHAAMVYEGRASGMSQIGGRTIGNPDRPTFRTNWPEARPGAPYSQAWIDENHIWGRVRSITAEDEVVPVYDLEIEEDNSFVAEGIVVHNCQDLTVNEGEDTFFVSYRYGEDPPLGADAAAAQLACQIVQACPSASGEIAEECELPAGTVRLTRQGVTIDTQSLGLWLLGSIRSGMPLVDAFMSVYARPQRRRVAIAVPEADPWPLRSDVVGT